MILSANGLNSLALATVVTILSWVTKLVTRFLDVLELNYLPEHSFSLLWSSTKLSNLVFVSHLELIINETLSFNEELQQVID